MGTPNEDMAAGVSADGSTNDATQVYDKKAGTYNPSHVQGKDTRPGQAPSTVQPFGNVRAK